MRVEGKRPLVDPSGEGGDDDRRFALRPMVRQHSSGRRSRGWRQERVAGRNGSRNGVARGARAERLRPHRPSLLRRAPRVGGRKRAAPAHGRRRRRRRRASREARGASATDRLRFRPGPMRCGGKSSPPIASWRLNTAPTPQSRCAVRRPRRICRPRASPANTRAISTSAATTTFSRPAASASPRSSPTARSSIASTTDSIISRSAFPWA